MINNNETTAMRSSECRFNSRLISRPSGRGTTQESVTADTMAGTTPPTLIAAADRSFSQSLNLRITRVFLLDGGPDRRIRARGG
jgi:hypothetical protein